MSLLCFLLERQVDAGAIDCVVAFSACPDDVYPINGGDGTPADAHFAIFDPAA